MNHQGNTEAGPKYDLNDFMRVSIALKAEMDEKGLPRYTYIQKIADPLRESPTTSPQTDIKSIPTVIATPRTPGPSQSAATNGASSSDKEVDVGRPVTPPPEFLLVAPVRDVSMLSASPTSPTSPSEAPNPDDPSQIISVVRFVLDASRARDEKLTIAPYYDIVEQEVTEERDLWVPKISPSAKLEKERVSPPPRERDRDRERDERDRDRGDRDRDAGRDRRRTYTPPPSTTRAPFLKHPTISDRRPDSPPSRRASPPPRHRDDRNRRGNSPPVSNNRNSGSRWENDRNRDRSPANNSRGGGGVYRRGNNDRERDRSRDRSPPSRGDREERDRDSRYRRDDRNNDRGRYYRD